MQVEKFQVQKPSEAQEDHELKPPEADEAHALKQQPVTTVDVPDEEAEKQPYADLLDEVDARPE